MSVFYSRTNVHCLPGVLVCLLAMLSLMNALHSQELDQVSTYIDAETSALVRIDSTAFDALIDAAKQDGQDPEQTVLELRLKQTRDLLGGDPIWMTIGFPQTPLSIKILIRDPDGKRIDKLKGLWDFPSRPPFGPDPAVVIEQLKDSGPQTAGNDSRLDQWKKLIVAPQDNETPIGAIQFGCLPPEDLYDTYRELLTDLPDYLGGGPVTVLTEGLQGISGAIDLRTGAVKGTISSASPAAATAFGDRATRLLASLPTIQEKNSLPKLVRPLLQWLKGSTFKPDQSHIHWQIAASDDWQPKELLRLAVGSEASRSARRLRNLTIGIHNYESVRQHLPPPPAARGPNGPTGLSWRVHILPFMWELNLYKQFKLDQPWDSPTNLKLLPKMPDVYSSYGSALFAPVDAKPGYTNVVAPISENTILGSPKKVTLGSITDGTSNTILMLIVKDSLAVPWTAPQDYVFDVKKPAAGMKFSDGKAPVAWCDGSTELLSEDNDDAVWLESFEMNDGGIGRPK